MQFTHQFPSESHQQGTAGVGVILLQDPAPLNSVAAAGQWLRRPHVSVDYLMAQVCLRAHSDLEAGRHAG